MFVVGPKITAAFFAIDSLAINLPAVSSRSRSKVDANPVPLGKHPEGTPSKNFVPLIPFGPSETLTAGIPNRSIFLVCQKSTAESKEIFSSWFNSLNNCSTSNLDIFFLNVCTSSTNYVLQICLYLDLGFCYHYSTTTTAPSNKPLKNLNFSCALFFLTTRSFNIVKHTHYIYNPNSPKSL